MNALCWISTMVRGAYGLQHDVGASTGPFPAGFRQTIEAPGGVVCRPAIPTVRHSWGSAAHCRRVISDQRMAHHQAAAPERVSVIRLAVSQKTLGLDV